MKSRYDFSKGIRGKYMKKDPIQSLLEEINIYGENTLNGLKHELNERNVDYKKSITMGQMLIMYLQRQNYTQDEITAVGVSMVMETYTYSLLLATKDAKEA
jgi:hypothetical protein